MLPVFWRNFDINHSSFALVMGVDEDNERLCLTGALRINERQVSVLLSTRFETAKTLIFLYFPSTTGI